MTPRADYQFELTLAPDEIVVDSFAGGGGASEGIKWALGRDPHIAINHDREAIALHAANHPDSEHHPEDVWHVDPAKACRGRKVGLMWLSPDCKHFSKAKGGKPVSKKIRGLAWTACRWAKAARPRVIVLENVEEFETWGPLILVDGKWLPDPARKGHTFQRFVGRLRRLGYVVEWRILRACDYGAPTIRKRLFLIARCDGRSIVWPTPTHGDGRAQPWRTAAECIDWSIACPSIFGRRKPLADNTMRRIARGVQRYVIDAPDPFIVQYHSPKRSGDDRIASIALPLGTQTTENRFGVVTPFIGRAAHGEVDRNGKRRGQGAHDITEPLGTVLASGEFSLVSPVIAGVGGRAGQSPERRLDVPYQTITAKADAAIVAPHLVSLTHHGSDRVEDIASPFATITGAHRGEKALAVPFLKPRFGEDPDPSRRGGLGQAPRVRSLEEPAPTIVPTGNGGDLVSAFLAKHQSERHDGEVQAAPLDACMPTIKTRDSSALVAAHVSKFYGTTTGHAAGEPLHTITGGGEKFAEVRAFLCAYYGNEKDGGSLRDPARTVTSEDRFGLVTVAGVEYAIVDIGMRMLAPRELYTAQGFPPSYRIDIEYDGKPMTKTAQVRMVGNSVCPPLAAAIVRANLVGETFAPNVSRERVA